MKLLFRVAMAIVLTLALLIGVVFLLPGEKIARLAIDQIEQQTGREMEISGKVRFSLWPVLGVRTGALTVANADWVGPDAPPMLRAEGVSIGVAMRDLLAGVVRVTGLTVTAPEVHLATDANGRGNWEFDTGAAGGTQTGTGAAETATQMTEIAIEKVTIRQAAVTWAAHGEEPIRQGGIELDLKWPDPQGTADILLSLRPADDPVSIEAQIGSFARFLGGEVASAGVTIRSDAGRARFDGRAGLSGEASGRLTGELSNPERFLDAMGLQALEQAGLQTRAVFGADVTYTQDGRLALRDLVLEKAENRITGAADLDLAQSPPELTAQVSAGALDLTPITETATAAPVSASGAGDSDGGWSREVIDASALALMEGRVDLQFEALTAGEWALGASKLNLTLDRSRAVLTLAPARIFGGTVNGQLVANNRSGLSVGGKLSFNDIALNQALAVMADTDKLNGSALGQVEFLGVGEDLDTIMRSLSGSGWFEVGKGFFTGFDLEELMRSGGGNGGSTVFETLTAGFTMQDGNLQNPDLLMTLKRIRAEGAGRIGLGAQDLDYVFTPIAGGTSGQGFRIPVKIRGAWSDPSIRPDLSAAIASDPDLKAAEEKARAKLGEELDRKIAPDEDLEDAIKDGLEKKAVDELLKILGGN